MTTVDHVVVDSIYTDSLGNIFFIAVDPWYVEIEITAYVAYHFDRRIGELNIIISGVSFEKAREVMNKFREGERI